MAARFENLVSVAKKHINEISPQEAAETAKKGNTLIIDVRDSDESAAAHISNAKTISRGTLEIEIEELAPDPSTPIICYCGGGGRSRASGGEFAKNGLYQCEVDGRRLQSLAG
jgi:rhodanese-related sulfurtransferase